MHALFFEVKTAHLSVQTVARRLAQMIDLTPARLDMLVAIKRVQPFPGARQDELRRILHVSTSNVSRMVRSLEQRGWVARTRDEEDRRTWRVRLTQRALAILESDEALWMKACARKVVRRLVCRGEPIVDTMLKVEGLFHWIRRLTGRVQTQLYAYGHPDE